MLRPTASARRGQSPLLAYAAPCGLRPSRAKPAPPLLPRGPGGHREDCLALRELLGPHQDLLSLLPLQERGGVADLDGARVDLEAAVDRIDLELADGRGELLLVYRAHLLQRRLQDLSGRVVRGAVIVGRATELLLIAGGELAVAGPRHGRRPLGRAEDEFARRAQVPELRFRRSDGDSKHFGFDA